MEANMVCADPSSLAVREFSPEDTAAFEAAWASFTNRPVRLLPGGQVARPLEEWREDIGDVLWWKFPVTEPPYCGSPQDCGQTIELHSHSGIEARAFIGGWPGYHTHWTRFAVPDAPLAPPLVTAAQ
jgi:hypothetical protein